MCLLLCEGDALPRGLCFPVAGAIGSLADGGT